MSHSSVPNRLETNRAGSNLKHYAESASDRRDCALLDASTQGRIIDGSCHEAAAWAFAVEVHTIMANKKDLTNRSPLEVSFIMKPTHVCRYAREYAR